MVFIVLQSFMPGYAVDISTIKIY